VGIGGIVYFGDDAIQAAIYTRKLNPSLFRMLRTSDPARLNRFL